MALTPHLNFSQDYLTGIASQSNKQIKKTSFFFVSLESDFTFKELTNKKNIVFFCSRGVIAMVSKNQILSILMVSKSVIKMNKTYKI